MFILNTMGITDINYILYTSTTIFTLILISNIIDFKQITIDLDNFSFLINSIMFMLLYVINFLYINNINILNILEITIGYLIGIGLSIYLGTRVISYILIEFINIFKK